MTTRLVAGLYASLVVVSVACGSAETTPSSQESATTIDVDSLSEAESEVATSTTPTTSTTTTIPVLPGDCSISSELEVGVESDDVLCLERHLAAGEWFDEVPDNVFDEATRVAVRTFQAYRDPSEGVIIDGIAGKQTIQVLGLWVDPPPPEPDPETCADIGNAAVLAREFQRAWLCEDDEIIHVFPVTTAWDQPDPGDYEVEQRSRNASSILTGSYSEMEFFVVFTYGKFQGARVGFHSVPMYPSGEYVQPLESVGTPELHGDSNGCIRALYDDAELVWDHLDFGDVVRVIS